MTQPTYTLWLVPSAPERSSFVTEINTLSSSLGTPPFEPHVTLLTLPIGTSLTSVKSAASDLSASFSSLNVTFTGVEAGTDVKHWNFRCVYLRIELQEELKKIYNATKSAFSLISDDIFMPHLSLCYSDCSAEIRNKARDESAARRIHDDNYIKSSVLLNRIQVWDCSGVITKRWHMIAEYPLSP
jgi:2'-5' RNA ligase